MALESIYGTCMTLLYLVYTMNENAITVNLLSHQLRSFCSHSRYDILPCNTWMHCERKYRCEALINKVRFNERNFLRILQMDLALYTILIKVSYHVPPVIKNKLLDYMVDKWWFVCKPWYQRDDLEPNLFHYLWHNFCHIGVQQHNTGLYPM